tara:strand:- start:165 stop:1013 length:849 start_codon:yes stop_codon:yes gene_type:complete
MYKSIFQILRVHNLILGSFAVAVSAYLLNFPLNLLTIYCMLIVKIIMALAYIMNDCLDMKSDKINHPDRPLANHRISTKYVIYITSILFSLLLILMININYYALQFLFLFVFPLTILYNLYFKNMPIIGNLITSILLGSIFMFSEIVLNSSTHILILPFFLCVTFNLLREMIKDMHDYDGDLSINAYTAPVYFGKIKMNKFIIIYTIFLMLLYLLPYFIFHLDIEFLLLLLLLIEIPLLYSVFLLIKFPKKKTYKYLSDLLKYLCLGGLLIIMLTKNSYIYV